MGKLRNLPLRNCRMHILREMKIEVLEEVLYFTTQIFTLQVCSFLLCYLICTFYSIFQDAGNCHELNISSSNNGKYRHPYSSADCFSHV